MRISDWSSDVCSSDLKYTYDHGWLALGPGARCAAGLLFGMTLAAAGEWLRRRPLQRAIAAIGPNYLPPALTAAGVAPAFGSLYARSAARRVGKEGVSTGNSRWSPYH